MKLFEYMASRRPIVASATPANREIVSEEEAVLYKSDDVTSLIGAIENVLGDPTAAAARAERAAARVAAWTWPKRARRVLDFID
jgi:glycosyltransferase involved in cell wall biosynthesis